MRVFAIIAPRGSDALDTAVRASFPGNFFAIAPGQYLVAVPGLVVKEVGELLGEMGKVGQVMVLPFETRWGWHRTDMWEWAQARERP